VDFYNIGCTPEFALAATKTFTMTCLKLINEFRQFTKRDLCAISNRLKYVWEHPEIIKLIAQKYKDIKHILVLGTGINYPIALEGALKLKEDSGIHAEALPAAEVKHGPIALVDDQTLAIFIVNFPFQNGIIDNHNQIKSSGGKTIIIGENDLRSQFLGCDEYIGHTEEIDWTPGYEIPYQVSQSLANNMVLQLLSYYLAVVKQLNPDKPRHLCKTITV
jgi:glucosamine--fructose-6-phosphate aminotransferase (isomerizing)